ncbi:hypothetical protein [Hymenobacter defluvii]|uniref:Uncharacterized protein n=1 Tax=Hymenobacter defluvii TaxID=2054411 RepID=A0ABS3T6K4_9BACT|nr:hypothetical protein [Hymenobacter defluvii]MBO3269276.1 hypothetical protein [Hymenobacter defluvii]
MARLYYRRYTGHILRNNLLILLATAAVAAVLTGLFPEQPAYMILFAFGYVLQALVNILIGVGYLMQPAQGSAAPYFLSALLVLLIGFGACAGIVTMVL